MTIFNPAPISGGAREVHYAFTGPVSPPTGWFHQRVPQKTDRMFWSLLCIQRNGVVA